MTAPVIIGSFSPEQLEARKKTLGASEIAAVAGLSPYQSALDVYLVKRGIVPSFSGNEFTEWGNRLEDVIARKYADLQNVVIGVGKQVVSAAHPWMSATPDRIVAYCDRGLECKNRGARMAHQWGESGTDLIPLDVAAQCHWSMMVTGLTTWDVAVLIGGCDFRWYRLGYDAEIAEALQEKGYDFWFNHVEKGIEPPVDGSAAWTDYLKKKFSRHTEQLREGDTHAWALINDLADAKARAKDAEERQVELENQIKALIGDAAGIITPDGSKATWKASKPTVAIDWQGMAEQLLAEQPPEIRYALVAAHQKEKPGSRRFLISIPKE